MKVWVLEEGDRWETSHVEKVFSDYKKAKAAQNKMAKEYCKNYDCKITSTWEHGDWGRTVECDDTHLFMILDVEMVK